MVAITTLAGCKDDNVEQPAPVVKPESGATVEQINTNIRAEYRLVDAQSRDLQVKTFSPSGTKGNAFKVELSDGSSFNLYTAIDPIKGGGETTVYAPAVIARADGDEYYWDLDGSWLNIETSDRHKVLADNKLTPVVGVDADGHWTVKLNGKTSTLPQTLEAGKVTSRFRGVAFNDDATAVKFEFNGSSPAISLPVVKQNQDPDPVPMGNLRRPISPTQPAWLVHIDSWNYADPEKIMALIPDDIKPYVIFNLSLSVSHDESTGRFKVSEYGYEIVKSWLRVCGEHNVWAMIQPASGGYCHFPDVASYEDFNDPKFSLYKEFFSYPNFLGFNYCEQFWGFDSTDALYSPSWTQRVAHWEHLLKLTNEYGGYLVVSFCSNYWSAPINPIAMVKRNPGFAAAAKKYAQNFVMCEKYTQSGMFFDVESMCLGTWLSGVAGNYGIRFDQCAWNDQQGEYYGDKDYPTAAGAALQLEHIALTGQTVIDGPELIWQQDFKEVSAIDAGDGFKTRAWETFPQFDNINIDLFRKILDGTIRILTRQEVIDRSKLIVLQDVTSGDDRAKYCTPLSLHEGLYRLDFDQNLQDNHFYLKKSGRYPTIPLCYELTDAQSQTFAHKVLASSANSMWADISKKKSEFDALFPEEYTGDLYAGRHENLWVVYNPYKDLRSASIPFKYNTASRMELSFNKFSTGVFREYANRLTCYLTNYDPSGKQKTETFRIYGCSSRPSCTAIPRQDATLKTEEAWADGVFTLTVTHNGPVDITIGASGTATGRETAVTPATLIVPASPQKYTGALQHEAECFDYKNISRSITGGYNDPIRNYTGQGYISYGRSGSAAVRDEFLLSAEGMHTVQIRYRAPQASVSTVDLYVNGAKMGTVQFTATPDDNNVWETVSMPATFKTGVNTVELRSTAAAPGDLYIDNIIIERL